MKFEVVVGGTVIDTFSDRIAAEKRLYEIRHSILAIVHPVDCIFIREK